MPTPLVKRLPDKAAEIDREAVIAQLEKILEYPAFRSSIRSARFLRYIVEHWLSSEHHTEPLKERTLGVALFGLDPAYDTTQNTVVRNAAVDVRKRLVLYYLEPGHAGEIQITLPAGSYVPQIHASEHEVPVAEVEGAEPHPAHEESREGQSGSPSQVPLVLERRLTRKNIALLALIVVVAIGIGGIGSSLIAGNSSLSPIIGKADLKSLNLFWRPVLEAVPPEPIILVCVGQLAQPVNGGQVTPVGNVFAAADIARMLSIENVKFRIEVANAVTSEHLQMSTAILIGGIDNPWTSFVTENLRFHIVSQNDPGSNGTVWIEDRKNQGKRDWSFSPPSQNSGEVADYALLARFKDQRSGQWRVLVSGLGGVGTSTASQALVLASSMTEITKQLPAGWASKNIEIVLKVKVINGKPGYPQMVTYEMW
jgi:hypothetical protein